VLSDCDCRRDRTPNNSARLGGRRSVVVLGHAVLEHQPCVGSVRISTPQCETRPAHGQSSRPTSSACPRETPKRAAIDVIFDASPDLVFMDVTSRLAKQLLQLAQQFGSQENGAMRVTHDLTQQELAQLVGSSRETVNKALTDFARRGWIWLDGGKSLLILDSEALAGRGR